MDPEPSTNPLDHPGVVAAAAASPEEEEGGHQEHPSQTGETATHTKGRLFTIQVTLSSSVFILALVGHKSTPFTKKSYKVKFQFSDEQVLSEPSYRVAILQGRQTKVC